MMSRPAKLWLAAGVFLMLLGGVLFAGAMAASDWDFTGLGAARYETNTYEPGEAFDNISIGVETAEIVFAPSGDGRCRIVCFEAENMRHSAAVRNGTLVIGTVDTRKWYDHIGIFHFYEQPTMTVYLPQKAYALLKIEGATGDVAIPADFSFEALEVRLSTGDVTVEAPSVGALRLSTATGRINVRSVGSEGDLELKTSTGAVELTDVTCADLRAESSTGTITLNNVTAAGAFRIRNSTGGVRFENSDAARISVRTSTGSVTGTLRSEKVFITETSTGKIDVPKTLAGGSCEITTSTGSIRIALADQERR